MQHTYSKHTSPEVLQSRASRNESQRQTEQLISSVATQFNIPRRLISNLQSTIAAIKWFNSDFRRWCKMDSALKAGDRYQSEFVEATQKEASAEVAAINNFILLARKNGVDPYLVLDALGYEPLKF